MIISKCELNQWSDNEISYEELKYSSKNQANNKNIYILDLTKYSLVKYAWKAD